MPSPRQGPCSTSAVARGAGRPIRPTQSRWCGPSGCANWDSADDNVPAAAVGELCEALLMRWHGVDRTKQEVAPRRFPDHRLLVNHFAAGVSDDQRRAEGGARATALGSMPRTSPQQLYAAATSRNGPRSRLVSAQRARRPDGPDKPGPRGANGLPARRAESSTPWTPLIRARACKRPGSICLESVLEEIRAGDGRRRRGPALRQWIVELVASRSTVWKGPSARRTSNRTPAGGEPIGHPVTARQCGRPSARSRKR